MPVFPVDLATYLGPAARMQQQMFDLGEGLSTQSQTAGGEVLRSGGAARLWRGSLQLYPLRHGCARAMQAKVHALRGAGAYFMVGDRTHKGGTFSGTLAGVDASSTVISLGGVPGGQEIKTGDYVAWGYAGRIAFHQVVSGATAGPGGVASVEVVPPVRPGYALGVTVTIGTPKMRAVLVPGSSQIGASNIVATDGIRLDWTQTLREYP